MNLKIRDTKYQYQGNGSYEKGQIKLYAQYLFGNELQHLSIQQETYVYIQQNQSIQYFKTKVLPYVNPIQTSYCFKDIQGIILNSQSQFLNLLFEIQKTCDFLLNNNFTAQANLFIPGSDSSIILFTGNSYVNQSQSQLTLNAKVGDTSLLSSSNIYNTQVQIYLNQQLIFNELVEIYVDQEQKQFSIWGEIILITIASVCVIFLFSLIYQSAIYIKGKNNGKQQLQKELQQMKLFQNNDETCEISTLI